MTVARGPKPELRWGLPTGQELVLLLSWVFIGLSGADVLTNFFVDIVIDQTDISVTPAGVRLLSLGFLGPLTSEPSPSFGHWRRGDFASGCGHGRFPSLNGEGVRIAPARGHPGGATGGPVAGVVGVKGGPGDPALGRHGGDEGGRSAPSVPLVGKLLFPRGAWADHAGDRP